MRALLDVNVLIALLDAEHVHHEPARRWLRNNIRNGWATCPITQNGCLRIMSQPSYPGGLRSAQVAERLREATATRHHEFWPDSVSLLDPAVTFWRHIIGAKQITDFYLLALAVRRQGCFVTFDANVTTDAVVGAESQHLSVV